MPESTLPLTLTPEQRAQFLASSILPHQWAQDGTLQPIYDGGQLTFQKAQVEDLKKKRDQPKS